MAPERVWVVVNANGPVHVEDHVPDPALIAPSQAVHEYARVDRHSGTEVPDHERHVLARYGKNWAIASHARDAYDESVVRWWCDEFPGEPDEWRELPASEEP